MRDCRVELRTQRGNTVAAFGTASAAGGLLGPVLLGYILDVTGGGQSPESWGIAFAVLGGVILIGVVGVILIATLSGGDADAAAPGGPSAAVGGGGARCAAEMDACSADAECQAIMQAVTSRYSWTWILSARSTRCDSAFVPAGVAYTPSMGV